MRRITLQKENINKNCVLWLDLSSSPPGPYGQEVYMFRPEERFKAPPILPPHLLQVILNKDTNISVSFSLLGYTNIHFVSDQFFPASSHISSQNCHIVHLALCLSAFICFLQCDPALLPEPNHVMLNHLYALSIKVNTQL